MMDRRLLRAACTALTAALMAGCCTCMAVRAPGLQADAAGAYLTALFAAVVLQLPRLGRAWRWASPGALALVLGLLLWRHLPGLAEFMRQLPLGESALGEAELSALRLAAGRALSRLGGFLLALLLTALLRAPSGTPFALLLLLASLLFPLATNAELSLWTALPGLLAGVMAFALPGASRREGTSPALLPVAALLTVTALLLTPPQGVTWAPLENLAQEVRSIAEDYLRFTEERLAFSIGEQGYDRAGMIGDSVVSMLGGPANPNHGEVMRVRTQTDLLLRGSIKRSYTGYSWVDDTAKARYLYYDPTHRRVRQDAFDSETNADNPAFAEHSAEVELLSSGTSTLFAPAQLSELEMNLRDALYYNSIGELFLTRGVRPGDRYALRARLPRSRELLIASANAHAADADERLEAARSDYLSLPAGIDSRVYELAVELTQNSTGAAEKAYAIVDYLAQNCRYTLEGGIPDDGEDFVSWFLLEERAGYCSYFASAMTVLCRIAGLPSRYVEGYAVEAQGGGETLVRGDNAHAWVEVCLNGLGWVAFDPTAAARQAQGSGGEPGVAQGEPNPDSDLMEESGEGGTDGRDLTAGELTSPGSSPEPGRDATAAPGPESDGTASPDEGGDAESPQEDASGGDGGEDAASGDEADGADAPASAEEGRGFARLRLPVAILLLAALVALIVRCTRKRLRATDPLLRTEAPQDVDEAVLLLLRVTLTLLELCGYAPSGGETPVAFAQRTAEALSCPDCLRFVEGVTRCRYAGEPADAELLRLGRAVYGQLMQKLTRFSRLRFCLQRLLHGLGNTESIP